jgi:histidinol-phosphate aminotransferase
VLVLRTFSKAWGLAGLRVGYGVGSQTLIDAVVRSRGPYKVNALAERAATTAVREDEAWMRRVAAEAVDAREKLGALVRGRRGVRAWRSEGNFVFWQVDGSAREFAARFSAHGIGVRAFSGLAGIGEALRIGVAPWAQLQRLAPVIEELWP